MQDRFTEAQDNIQELFAQQEPVCGKLDYYQALARGLKYNLDYRMKRANAALQAGELKVAVFTMFPALNESASIYNRNNQYASSGITSTGQPTDVLNSTPNTIRSERHAATWNMLDFGAGYVKAKQQGDRVYVAQEESRRQIQQMSQDILVAYWNAYTAQEMIDDVEDFNRLLTSTKNKLAIAVKDKAIPQEQLLNYEAALLEGNRRIIQLRFKHQKALLNLKHLTSLPANMQLMLAPPPQALSRIQNLRRLNFDKLDAITLVNRAELRSQQYQERIAKWGIKLALWQALPGITLNYGGNYNSNKFLLNKTWIDRSVDLAWNLLNIASVPYTYKSAKTAADFEKLKLLALTVTVLTETRYAYSHYESLREEYVIVHEQTLNSRKLYDLNRNRQRATLASNQQVILSKLHTITTKMEEDIIRIDLSTAFGELYLSAGFDLLPVDVADMPLEVATDAIRKNFALENMWDFPAYVNKTHDRMFPPVAVAVKPVVKPVAKPVAKLVVKSPAKAHPATAKKQLAKSTLAKQATIAAKTRYTIQVASDTSVKHLKKLQHQFSNTRIITTQYKRQNRYILVYGSYKNKREAKLALNKLPQHFNRLKPWIRKI